MKKMWKRSISAGLSALMLLQVGEAGIAYAADEIDRKINPAEQIELRVPSAYDDGNNYFFIAEPDYTISEKSKDTLYIPIQRSGDTAAAAEVTLKVMDLSARHDVNYSIEVYKDDEKPEIVYGDVSILDLALDADNIEEFEPVKDENELGEIINEAGGADILDKDGNVAGSVSATPLDEDGNPIISDEKPADDEKAVMENAEAAAENSAAAAAETAAESESDTYNNVTEGLWQGWEQLLPDLPKSTQDTEAAEDMTAETGEVAEDGWTQGSGPAALRAARDSYTGTVSDRQEIANGSIADIGNMMTENEFADEIEDVTHDDYPGKEYRLHFNAGEEAKFICIKPKYSDAADGDMQIMLMLKDSSEGIEIGENVNPVSVTIIDEDEPEPVTISLASETVIAHDGKASITVTREGRINALKTVMVKSWGGSAEPGDEYSGIGAKLSFPMGIKSRTIDIPVYHGTEEKDFYITISADTDETIGTATTHVVIPTAETAGSAILMGNDEGASRTGRPVSDKLYLRDQGIYSVRSSYSSDYGVFASTEVDKEQYSYMQFKPAYKYAYDGLYTEYHAFVNWCKAHIYISRYYNGSETILQKNTFNRTGIENNHWLKGAWGKIEAPDKFELGVQNYDNNGWAWTKDYVWSYFDETHYIKRQFDIKVEPAEVKPLIGVKDEDVLRNYETVLLNNSTYDHVSVWTEDSFALNQSNKQSPLRLVGVEAKLSDGSWTRLVTIDGKSYTANVKLTPALIDSLAARGAISWSENGTIEGFTSYKGAITVRPIFEYIDVSVEIKNDANGSLSLPAPEFSEPTLVWDFNGGKESGSIGSKWKNQVSYVNASMGGDHFKKFTARGEDPFVSLDAGAAADDIQYVKIRYYTEDTAKYMQLFACIDGSVTEDSDVMIPIESGGWKETIVHIPDYNQYWTGKQVDWLRIDPMAMKNGHGVKEFDEMRIDYIAFFRDEQSAKAYKNSSYNSPSGRFSEPGVYNYHLGDRLDFTTVISDIGNKNNLKADGISYELRKFGDTGSLKNYNDIHYINNTISLELSGKTSGGATVDNPYYTVKPTFTENGNSVTVEVSKAALNYFDTTKGFLAEGKYVSRTESGDKYIYTVQQDVLTNVEMELQAVTSDEGNMPRWTVNGSFFWGDTVSFRTGQTKASNQLKLEVFVSDEGALLDDSEGVLMADTGFVPTYATITGTVASSTYNLSSERSATDLLPAEKAFVAYGDTGAWTDENGNFTLPAIFTMSGQQVSYTVTYNGVTSIRKATIPAAGAAKSEATTLAGKTVQAVTANAGLVKIENFSETGAHFTGAYANQVGQLVGTINGLTMNGKELSFDLNVSQDNQYVLNGETVTEHIREIRVWFQDQTTGEKHGQWSSLTEPTKGGLAKWGYDAENGVFNLTIDKFDPEHQEEWAPGDVLMAQIITDKKVGITAWTLNQMGRDMDMVYDPVSTGFGVYPDPEYEPMVFDYDIDNIAEQLDIHPQTDEDGKPLSNDSTDDTRYSFGAFPYVGEITAVVRVVSKVFNSTVLSKEAQMVIEDLEDMADAGNDDGDDGLIDIGEGGGELIEDDLDDEDDYDPADDGLSGAKGEGKPTQATISIFFKTDYTDYGGVRFMVGAIAAVGTGKGYQHQINPYASQRYVKLAFNGTTTLVRHGVGSSDLIDNQIDNPMNNLSQLGGPHFSFSVFFGFYLDYGYVEISKDGGTEKSHDMVYMGAGGFIGFNGKAGYTWSFGLGPVPAFINAEAGINVTFFLGSAGDSNKTLDSFKNSTEMHGQDFSFNFEFKGRVYASLTFGVGIYKILSVRVTGEVAFEPGYSLKMPKWYPTLFDSGWGYVTEATFTGTIDIVVTSIDVYSATWPLPFAKGFMYYFQEVRRANKCISYVENGLAKNNGSSSAQKKARAMADELAALVNSYSSDTETIKEKTYELKNYAYDNDIISWVAKNTIEMNKQGGIAGSIINGALQDDTDLSKLQYHTNEHTNSEWVAGDGSLMSAYSPVSSKELVKDAYSNPSSKLMSIGNNKMLMVFLDDTKSRDNMMASTLKWTIYDAEKDTWTEPQVIQNDNTADGKPHLADAGNKVILSWSSITDEKYNALKETVANEIKQSTGAEPSDYDVQQELEKDPARVMAQMDIFTAEFDKTDKKFGEVTQLTDDEYYDDYPQAVYDEQTGDYIVMYYKTAQDDSKYTDNGEKLEDLVGYSPDPDKNYSIICYMLYNNQTDTPDTNGQTHEPGWARNYLFENETALTSEEQAQYLAKWGGQRFLSSTLSDEDGEQTDPPIVDLTVANGYNGLAAYAFTVDKDFNLKTTEDKELYMQFYRFSDHSTYVPIKVAGSVTETNEVYDSTQKAFVDKPTTRQVDVGSPKLIRNGGKTFLFWREDGTTLKYLNISDMLSDTVASSVTKTDDGYTANESDFVYAVNPDGTFAYDALAGKEYEPNAQKVDFGSMTTADKIEITDYEIITDEEDNLYVVWTDLITNDYTNEAGETYPVSAQEIYASAFIKQEENKTVTDIDDEGNEGETTTTTQNVARWSKPYRLTRDNAFNDGLALGLDDNGDLIIVHNSYTKKTAESEEEMMQLIKEGKIGLTQDTEGKLYAASLSYNSPVSLMATRCEKIGSLEATSFDFSDDHPVPNETVKVKAIIENVGLTNAEGCDIEFYEYKDGKQGKLIYKVPANETENTKFAVNTAKTVSFDWTIPAEGADGYSIQAVIKEKNADGGYYDPVTSNSYTFETAPVYKLNLNEVTQDGDKFFADYSVENIGNAPAEEGTTVSLRLVGLHGDLESDRYGNITDNVINSEEAASSLSMPTEKSDSVYKFEDDVEIPVSVFKYCGYDAVQLVVADKDGNVIDESDQYIIKLETPVNLALNGGNAVEIKANDTKQVALSYDSTVFIDDGTVVYSIEDPDIAAVDDKGNVTAIANGDTTLTATLLPSGREVSVPVSVTGAASTADTTKKSSGGGGGGSSAKVNVYNSGASKNGKTTVSNTNPKTGDTVTVTVTPDEGYELDKLIITDSKGNEIEVTKNADGTYSYVQPEGKVTVKAEYKKAEGTDTDNNGSNGNENGDKDWWFKDVPETAWYYEPIKDAYYGDRMSGMSEDYFEPETDITRGMFAYAIYRREGLPETDAANKFADVREGSYYETAIAWAAENGIVSGYDDTHYAPDDQITREQMAAILYRYAQFKEYDVSVGEDTNILDFIDAQDISEYAVPAIQWAVGDSVITGFEDNSMRPKANANRAQMAVILNKIANMF